MKKWLFAAMILNAICVYGCAGGINRNHYQNTKEEMIWVANGQPFQGNGYRIVVDQDVLSGWNQIQRPSYKYEEDLNLSD